MRLIGSLTSPFVRFVRVTLAELHIEHEFIVTGPFGKASVEDERLINNANPLMKVPVLETGQGTIIDSRVIMSWLLEQRGGAGRFGNGFPESLARENTLTTVYGVLEAGILRFMLNNSHPEINMNSGYMARSLERLQLGMGWLDSEAEFGPGFGPPEALLVCSLEWFSKRRVCDWSGYQRLGTLVERFAGRESLIATRIPDII